MATVYKGSPAVRYAFTPGSQFLWGADYTHVPNTDPVVSPNSQFHIAGDWTFDPAVGRLCWRANFATTELSEYLLSTTNPSAVLHSNLWAFAPSGAMIVVAAWDLNVWIPAVNAAAVAPVVPIWGDGAYERRKDGRTQYLFPDGKWRAYIAVLVDGQPSAMWGEPED